MAHPNNLGFQPHGDWSSIEDYRWRVNTWGMEDGQNANLVIDDAIKAEGSHRVGGWVLSGVPVVRTEDNQVRMMTASDAKADGFLYNPHKITDVDGEFYTESIPVGVQVRGSIIAQWLPVEFPVEKLPDHFTNTVL